MNAVSLTNAQWRAVEDCYDAIGTARKRYCPVELTPKQEAFALVSSREALFGGAAGCGKSIALLMAALMYADVPGYAALLLRPSLNEFHLPGGLLEIATDWLTPSKATWIADQKTWRFPGRGTAGTGGATLTFGYLDGLGDLGRYFGSSFSFIGFDELTRFTELQYRRMHRVLRQPASVGGGMFPAAPDGTHLSDVPLRARATANPGGPGHEFVKSYFVDERTRRPGAVFVRAWLEDNPHLNADDYIASLLTMPSAERERLLRGDWNIPDEGALFQRDWFTIIEPGQVPETNRAIRYWDLAATEPNLSYPDPDYTVGLRLDRHDHTGMYYLRDIVRVRKSAGTVQDIVAATAQKDGRAVPIVIEQEPGASGVDQIQRYTRHVLRGYDAHGQRPTGPKDVRAHGVAAAAENHLLQIVNGPHVRDFLDEVCAFPCAPHDDCVDALAGAYNDLVQTGGRFRVSSPHKIRMPEPYWHRNSYYGSTMRAADRAAAELASQLGIALYNPRRMQM
jgi:predicted phage terminase large subunit-like protein